MRSLEEIADLANTILNYQTKYAADKKIITQIFNYTTDSYSEQAIISRLTIIDSYYSTQMNKRYYGLEDIAKRIWEISNREEDVKNQFLAFCSDQSNKKIEALFSEKHYGIHKDGTEAGMAISLISKYAYYQTGYKFPIYDSLSKKSFPLIMQKYFPKEKTGYSIDSPEFEKYLISLNKLKKISNINDYDKLDNLLWLSGKILEGNLSLILKEKNTYNLLAQEVKKNTPTLKMGGTKKYEFSERILIYIRNNESKLNEIIKDTGLKEFIEFALDLE